MRLTARDFSLPRPRAGQLQVRDFPDLLYVHVGHVLGIAGEDFPCPPQALPSLGASRIQFSSSLANHRGTLRVRSAEPLTATNSREIRQANEFHFRRQCSITSTAPVGARGIRTWDAGAAVEPSLTNGRGSRHPTATTPSCRCRTQRRHGRLDSTVSATARCGPSTVSGATPWIMEAVASQRMNGFSKTH